MLTYEARTTATPDRVWPLLAEPARWSAWAPHLRGAWGLGAPEVEPGARGAVRLLGFVPIPATIVSKERGSAWTWRVGPATLVHRVRPDADGATARGAVVAVDISAPGPVEATLRLTYGPLVRLLLRNLARAAARR